LFLAVGEKLLLAGEQRLMHGLSKGIGLLEMARIAGDKPFGRLAWPNRLGY
jgi:hypothetical protein